MGTIELFSCGNNTKKKNPQIDSSLYLNAIIKVGDTAINLAAKGILVPNVEFDEEFGLSNKTLAGIEFENAKVFTNDKRVKCLNYISKTYQDKKEFQKVSGKLFANLCKEYGKPTLDSSYIDKEGPDKTLCRDYKWETTSKIVFVSTHKTKWSFLGDDSYSMYAIVGIKDSVLKSHKLKGFDIAIK